MVTGVPVQIFDKEKEQNRLKEAQLIAEIGSQAMDIARTEGAIAGEKAKKDPAALAAARQGLTKKGKLNPTADEIAKQAYDTAMKPFGTGSSLQQGISAVTAAVQGLSGGNVAQAISGAAAPYLAEKIHELTTDANGKVNVQANLMAHAVLGAVTSHAAGNSALAGASGAVMGEYIAQQLYPGVERKALTEEQRQTISALGTLAAGLAGGLTGDSTADAVAGAQTGKKAVENNSLNLVLRGGKLAAEGCAKVLACRNKLIESGLGALIGATAATSAVEQLSSDQKTNIMLAAMSGDPALVDKLSSAERKAYDELQVQKGLITVFPVPEKDPTSGKLINPAQDQNNGTTLETPDQRDQNRANHTGGDQWVEQLPSNTGNTEGALDLPNYMESQGYDPRLPIPDVTTASNGLKVESNTKHTPGAQGFRPNAGIEPKNSLELFGNSVSIDGNKARYSMGADGSVHRYFPDNTGIYHWSGSTGDSKNPMQLDNKIKAQLRKQEGWKIK